MQPLWYLRYRYRSRFAFAALLAIWLGVALGAMLLPLHAQADDAALDEAFAQLKQGGFAEKSEAISRLAASGHARTATILQALLDGRLYHFADKDILVIAEPGGAGYRVAEARTGDAIGEATEAQLSKITINNALRGKLKSAIAGLNLTHPDARVRLTAVNGMLERMTPELATQLRELLERETDERVREAMRTAIGLDELASGDKARQLAAVKLLGGSIEPAVRNQLSALAESEADRELARAAREALRAIEGRLQFYSGVETLFFGLSLGSVLVLAAIGLAITFGVMGVINMAHGELIMLGAYTTYIVQQLMPQYLEWSLLVALPAAFIVSGLVGIVIERTVIRFLYGRPLETLLATFGISLILQQLVRTLISPQNVPVANPAWMSGSVEINTVLSLTLNRLYIIVFCLVVFVGLYLILKRTQLGLQVRAVSQNRAMARAMGVRSARVDALTFGLGSGIAGVAGVALSQLTNVGPNLGQAYIIDSFMVVVFGGVGNLVGTLVGGLSLGVANKLLEPWSGAVLAKILVLVFIILFIQKRPRGLFPQKGRAAEG